MADHDKTGIVHQASHIALLPGDVAGNLGIVLALRRLIAFYLAADHARRHGAVLRGLCCVKLPDVENFILFHQKE